MWSREGTLYGAGGTGAKYRQCRAVGSRLQWEIWSLQSLASWRLARHSHVTYRCGSHQDGGCAIYRMRCVPTVPWFSHVHRATSLHHPRPRKFNNPNTQIPKLPGANNGQLLAIPVCVAYQISLSCSQKCHLCDTVVSWANAMVPSSYEDVKKPTR